MTMQHTPGPWGLTISEPPEQWVLYSKTARGPGKSQCKDVGRLIATQADARLIAAAPDMLAALLNVRQLISEAAMTGFNYRDGDGDWAERLFASQAMTSAAIAKATGRTPVATVDELKEPP